MKLIILIILILTGTFFNLSGQEVNYTSQFNLTLCSASRNLKAVLWIKDNTEKTFSGKFVVDNVANDVFGWYTEKKSEIYTTEGIAFYVKYITAGYQHQQLFKGIFNYDKTIISGNYFYWGNEFGFYGNKEIQTTLKSQIVEADIKIYPNPVENYLVIDSNQKYAFCKIYDMAGNLVSEKDYQKKIIVCDLNIGTYILVLVDNECNIEKIKFVKQ
jgi:hypothetical protein